MIYLDYNATTPIDAAVKQAILPYISSYYGNPSSDHIQGRIAREAVEKARGQVAGLLRAQRMKFVLPAAAAKPTTPRSRAWHGTIARAAGGSSRRRSNILLCSRSAPGWNSKVLTSYACRSTQPGGSVLTTSRRR